MGKKVEAVKAVIEEYKARMAVDGEFAKTYISTVVRELEGALSGKKDEPTEHYLTAEDFATVPSGDLLYIGPLDDALAYVKRYGDYDGEATKLPTGSLWEVTLLNGDNWGRGDTPELAWRYVFGAYFGPIDEGFTPQYLR